MFRLWSGVFLLVNLIFPIVGGPNPDSRMAALASYVEDGDFEISQFAKGNYWTNDWAQNKKGEVFSNKAPGPVLLALPLYALIDKIEMWGLSTKEQREERRFHLRHLNGHILSMLFQVLFTIGLMSWILRVLQKRGVSEEKQEWLLLAIYFGNLASLFMNTYFGHALAGSLLLATYFAYEQRQYLWSGFFLGFALLSDYSIGIYFLLFSLLLLFTEFRRSRWRHLLQLFLGGFLPFVLWVWYHVKCFGGILSIALANQSPEHKDLVGQEGQAWGVISLFPKFQILGFLIFHPGRGIFWTSPWIPLSMLALLLLFPKKVSWDSSKSKLLFLALGSFVGLWMMNAAFGHWRAGASPGSRYLCLVFPLWAYAVLRVFPATRLSLWKVFWGALMASLLFFIAVYSTTILLGDAPLWIELFGRIFASESKTPLLRFLGLTAIFVLAGCLRLTQRFKKSRTPQ